MLLKFLTVTRFVYFSTWINAVNALHAMPVITTQFAIKTVNYKNLPYHKQQQQSKIHNAFNHRFTSF